jgi:septal ring-binding cell division protein DamX
MEKGDPKEVELEDELDSLYRKVSSRDQSEEAFHAPQQLKTEAMVAEEPGLHTGAEKWPSQKRETRRFRSSRIIFALLPALILGLITIFYWPVFYHYDALIFEGKVYPLRINRLTGEAAYFDGAEWLRPPIPAEVKNAPPEKQLAQSAAALPPAIDQAKTPAEDKPAAVAPLNTHSELKYAIQIRSFPENKKDAATGFVDGMKKKLPDVRMETANIRGRGIWHRILLGNFSSMEKASIYMKENKISLTFPGSFVQRKSAGES